MLGPPKNSSFILTLLQAFSVEVIDNLSFSFVSIDVMDVMEEMITDASFYVEVTAPNGGPRSQIRFNLLFPFLASKLRYTVNTSTRLHCLPKFSAGNLVIEVDCITVAVEVLILLTILWRGD